jgi:metallo-beta-lactamase class B
MTGDGPRMTRIGRIVTDQLFILALLALLGRAPALGQADETWRSWNRPVKPFRVVGNIYYVGASDVTSFLITTPQGHILLDGGFAETAPLIKESVRQLGFRLEDVKVLINSHAHSDHAGGLAELKKLTGAQLAASEADAPLLAAGGKDDFSWGDKYTYPPVRADRLLSDGDRVELGGVTMTARLTPGHTKGCTTWTTKVKEDGRELDVLFIGSTTIPGHKLVGNVNYPGIAEDYARSFALLKTLPCDVFLAPHGSFFSLTKKMGQPPKPNPFVDPRAYRRYIQETEKAYLEQLRKERGGR